MFTVVYYKHIKQFTFVFVNRKFYFYICKLIETLIL